MSHERKKPHNKPWLVHRCPVTVDLIKPPQLQSCNFPTSQSGLIQSYTCKMQVFVPMWDFVRHFSNLTFCLINASSRPLRSLRCQQMLDRELYVRRHCPDVIMPRYVRHCHCNETSVLIFVNCACWDGATLMRKFSSHNCRIGLLSMGEFLWICLSFVC